MNAKSTFSLHSSAVSEVCQGASANSKTAFGDLSGVLALVLAMTFRILSINLSVLNTILRIGSDEEFQTHDLVPLRHRLASVALTPSLDLLELGTGLLSQCLVH